MIICKYEKSDSAVFIPHLDLLRAVGMGIRRQELNINFSEGFNPHAKIFFGQPLPIGTASVSEYFCCDTTEPAGKFMDCLNKSLPAGVKILKAAAVEDNPNVANLMAIADYNIKFQPFLPRDIDFSSVMSDKELIISYITKGEYVTKNVKEMVFGIKNTESEIFIKVACGNVNLRADRLINHLLKSAGLNPYTDITKTAMYDKTGKNLDEIFFK